MFSQMEWVVVFIVVSGVRSAKILGVFNVPSVSHQVVYQPIWKELSLRGHEVTVMSPNPLRDPSLTNLTEIDLSYLYEHIVEVDVDMAKGLNHWQVMEIMFSEHVEKMIEPIFIDSRVKELISNSSKEFDVVLSECLTPLMGIFAHRFNCPLIGIASLSVTANTHASMGTPLHPTLYSNLMITFGEEQLSLIEKVDVFLFTLWNRYYYYNVGLPSYDQFLRKYFGNDIPSLETIERNVSLLLLNTNPIIHKPRPYPPNVIQLGRMHIKPKKQLPQELKQFLDNAQEGVIYFSFGSNVKSTNLDEAKRNIIMNTLGGLPYKVLWKFEADNMPNKPDNVKISKWLPQQDLLGHPNIKLFITQGGLQSLEEAILNKVPLLAIPFMADQHANAKRITKLGIGLDLGYNTLTSDEFKKTILEIVENLKYKDKVAEIASLLEDEPMTGLERAVWWTEYVIRHKGAPYFRVAAADISWSEFLLLDVLAVLFLVFVAVLYIIYKTLSITLKLLRVLVTRKTKVA